MPRSYKGRNEKETERIRRKRETERQRGREGNARWVGSTRR